MPINGVLFDFDGTLTSPGAIDFIKIKNFLECPMDQTILEFIESLNFDQQQEAYTFLDSHEEEAAKISVPAPGAESIIWSFKTKNLPLGIITRNSLKAVLTALDNFVLTGPEDFAIILTRDDAPCKPDPEGVIIAAKKMGIPPGELLMVGDFSFDITAGHAAGARTVLIEHHGAPEMPPCPEPDYRISHLGELDSIVMYGSLEKK